MSEGGKGRIVDWVRKLGKKKRERVKRKALSSQVGKDLCNR